MVAFSKNGELIIPNTTQRKHKIIMFGFVQNGLSYLKNVNNHGIHCE